MAEGGRDDCWWCSPGRHALPYDELVAAKDRLQTMLEQRLGAAYRGRHKRE